MSERDALDALVDLVARIALEALERGELEPVELPGESSAA